MVDKFMQDITTQPRHQPVFRRWGSYRPARLGMFSSVSPAHEWQDCPGKDPSRLDSPSSLTVVLDLSK